MELRPILLVTRVVCVFVGVTALLLSCFRGPLVAKDYLIAGVIATLAGMGTVFVSFAPKLAFNKASEVTRPGEPQRDGTPQKSEPDPRS